MSYSDLPIHQGSESGPFTFMYYGRLGYAKGVDLLLQAYQELLKIRQDHRLIMVIPSEQQPTSKPIYELIEQIGVGDHLQLMHDLDYNDLIQQIANVDAVVIPSYSEGFCFAAAETVAIGTPIISSGQGALKEVVSGLYQEVEEFCAAGLTAAMHEALEGNWKSSAVKQFELEDTIASYIALYKSLA